MKKSLKKVNAPLKRSSKKVNAPPARASARVEYADDQIRQFGIVHSIRISTPSLLAFDGVTASALVVATVIITSFGKALLGKAAEATWSLLASRFDRTLPAAGKIQVVYRSKSAEPTWELVVTYPDVGALKRDKRNHRIYLAIAEGFAVGRTQSLRESVSLLSAIPSESRTRPSELCIRQSV